MVGLLVGDVEVLLARNARVDITSRDRNGGRGSVDECRGVSDSIYVLSLDLSYLRSVRGMVDEFMRYVPPVYLV